MKLWCGLLLCLLPAFSWAGALHCDIDTGGALPFAPFTRENPIAVDENTPDYTVVLSLDYAQFLPNMRLSCTSDGQDLDAPANFDGNITLSFSTVNDKALDWAGEAQTNHITGISKNIAFRANRREGGNAQKSVSSVPAANQHTAGGSDQCGGTSGL